MHFRKISACSKVRGRVRKIALESRLHRALPGSTGDPDEATSVPYPGTPPEGVPLSRVSPYRAATFSEQGLPLRHYPPPYGVLLRSIA
jgi:hypothetical protein